MNDNKDETKTQALFNTKKAAKFLGVDRKTIQNYRKAGILIPDKFGANNAVLYSEEQLIRAVRSLLTKIGSSGEMFLKKKPQVANCYEQAANCYEQVEKRYTEEQLKLVSSRGKFGIIRRKSGQ